MFPPEQRPLVSLDRQEEVMSTEQESNTMFDYVFQYSFG